MGTTPGDTTGAFVWSDTIAASTSDDIGHASTTRAFSETIIVHPLRTLVLSAFAGVALLATATAAGARPEIVSTEPVSPAKPIVTNGLRYHHGGLNNGSVPSRPTTRSEIITVNADHHPMTYHRMLHHGSRLDRVHADGHCNGRASGSGHRGCGTATGGPVGGLPNRN